MVTETNRYAEQFLDKERDNLRPHSVMCQWVPTSRNEMCAFLGLMMLMGIIYKPRIGMYWSNDELYSTPIFKSIMTRDHFLLMIKVLHFADNTSYDANDPNRDRLFKIRQMTEMINERCRAVYSPCEDLSLDESLVLFKGRLLFKQYIKTKRARFGIKLYELCTHKGIMLNFMIYHGNQEQALIQVPGDNWLLTERIPLTLLNPYLGKGHTVYVDNYYTTPRLAKYLLDHQTKLVGTVRTNRQNMVPNIAEKDLQKGKAAFYQCGDVLAVKYRGAKDTSRGKPKTVCLLTTAHTTQMRNTAVRDQEGNAVQKPACILSYNTNMGGVDMVDQQLHSLTVMRKSYKWYKKVFVCMMMMCVLSAHKLSQTQGENNDFLQFMHDVITLLLVEAPRFINRKRLLRDNILCLTGRHFP